MKSHDHLLDKQYDEEYYNCVHFAHEAAMIYMILIEERRLSFYEARQREGISAIKIEVTKSIAYA